MTIDEVMEQFPVTREQVKAVLEFAARSLDAPAEAAGRELVAHAVIQPEGTDAAAGPAASDRAKALAHCAHAEGV